MSRPNCTSCGKEITGTIIAVPEGDFCASCWAQGKVESSEPHSLTIDMMNTYHNTRLRALNRELMAALRDLLDDLPEFISLGRMERSITTGREVLAKADAALAKAKEE